MIVHHAGTLDLTKSDLYQHGIFRNESLLAYFVLAVNQNDNTTKRLNTSCAHPK